MMGEPGRIHDFLKDVTRDLRDDAELRLDVQAELRGHIEERADAFREDGKNDEDCEALALQAFGVADEIRPALLSANLNRMRWRGLLRLLLRMVLAPAVLIIGLFLVLYRPVIRPLLTSEPFIISGDTTRDNTADRMRAIWERDPQNKVYYGNYITHLFPDTKNPEGMVGELRRGMEIDPQNARYHYLLGGYWIDKAAGIETHYERNHDNIIMKSAHQWVITDWELLAKGFDEIRTGAEKPYLKRYNIEMLEEKLAAIAPFNYMEDSIRKITIGAGTLLPGLQYYRRTVQTIPRYAEELVKTGERGRAKEILDLWEPLTMHLLRDSEFLVDVLVVRALFESSRSNAEIYEELGFPEDAAHVREVCAKAEAVFEQYFKRNRKLTNEQGQIDLNPKEDPVARLAREHGCVLARMLVPALGEQVVLSEQDLAPGRWLEYVLLERVGVTAMVWLYLFLMLLALMVGIVWTRRLPASERPTLLVPPLRVWGKWGLYGLLLPLGLYVLYTRLEGLSGRAYGFSYRPVQTGLELLVLVVGMLLVQFRLTGRWLRQRCETLGIASPAESHSHAFQLWVSLLFVLTLFFLFFSICVSYLAVFEEMGKSSLDVMKLIPSIGCGGLLVLSLVHPCFSMWRMRRDPHVAQYAPYYAAHARSRLYIFAVLACVLALLAHPLLNWHEAALIRQDTILGLNHTSIGFTQIEDDLTKRIKEDVLKAVVSRP